MTPQSKPTPEDEPQDIWGWQDFYYLGGKSRMDSRRAAFLLYDFINMFAIEDFHILRSDGAFQNQSIDIAYKIPENRTPADIDDAWVEYLGQWKETH